MDNEQRLRDLERRRRRGTRLLAAGHAQAEVARRVGVSRQSVLRWERAREQAGPRGAAAAASVWSAAAVVGRAVVAAGARAEGRRSGGGFSDRTVDAAADRRADRAAVCRPSGAVLGVAVVAGTGLERATADGLGPRAQRAGDYHLEGPEVADPKEIAARQGRVIVFVDESGLSERPSRALGPRGARLRCCSTASTGSSSP